MADDPLSTDEQIEIVCQIIDRDERGLVRLMKAYAPRIKWLLKQKLGDLLTADDVDSVIDIAATKAWNSIQTFDEQKGSLGGWFYMIAYRAAIDIVRSGHAEAEPLVPLDFEPAVPAREPACVAPDEKEDPIIRDLIDEIRALGPTQRAIAEADLLADGEADAARLAERLGLTKQHIYSYRDKYLRALRTRIEKRRLTTNPARRRP